jgi:hypothetical protein
VAILTYSDALSYLKDYCGVDSDPATARMAYYAVRAALNRLGRNNPWSYYLRRLPLVTVASYSTGTIAYTNSTRTVTLTTGTWPSWAARGTLIIDDIHYPVYSRTSDSVIILSQEANPGEDIAAGESYEIYRDAYPLPVDFISLESPLIRVEENRPIAFVPPDLFNEYRASNNEPSDPLICTVTRDRPWIGPNDVDIALPRMAVLFKPPPDSAERYEAFYRFRPREMLIPAGSYTTGTVTESGATVTGVGTAFTSDMVGAVIRFGTSSTLPGGVQSADKYQYQRIVTARASATSITIDSEISGGIATGVKYEISDPLDVEPGAMWEAFLRLCECELDIVRHKGDIRSMQFAETRAKDAIKEARAADYRGKVFDSGRAYFDPVGDVTFSQV